MCPETPTRCPPAACRTRRRRTTVCGRRTRAASRTTTLPGDVLGSRARRSVVPRSRGTPAQPQVTYSPRPPLHVVLNDGLKQAPVVIGECPNSLTQVVPLMTAAVERRVVVHDHTSCERTTAGVATFTSGRLSPHTKTAYCAAPVAVSR